jgi:hypothetical protein
MQKGAYKSGFINMSFRASSALEQASFIAIIAIVITLRLIKTCEEKSLSEELPKAAKEYYQNFLSKIGNCETWTKQITSIQAEILKQILITNRNLEKLIDQFEDFKMIMGAKAIG